MIRTKKATKSLTDVTQDMSLLLLAIEIVLVSEFMVKAQYLKVSLQTVPVSKD